MNTSYGCFFNISATALYFRVVPHRAALFENVPMNGHVEFTKYLITFIVKYKHTGALHNRDISFVFIQYCPLSNNY
jgi:hypothetical protein